MKQGLSPAVSAGIIAVVVLIVGAAGYFLFLNEGGSSSGGMPPEAAARMKAAMERARDPKYIEQQKAAATQNDPAKANNTATTPVKP